MAVQQSAKATRNGILQAVGIILGVVVLGFVLRAWYNALDTDGQARRDAASRERFQAELERTFQRH